MISVKEATDIVLAHALELDSIEIALNEAIGKVLREPLIADRDFPPYNRVTMDGIALLHEQFKEGRRAFPIESIAAAGAPQQSLQDTGNCIEVMTGSILPIGTDVVIRYEDLEIKDGIAHVQLDKLKFRQNIHEQGEDRKQGSLVVPEGKVISSAEIGVAATVGKATLKIVGVPKAIIISTGDELVEVSEQPLAHQIRRSNVHRIKATLKNWGLEADTAHLIDNEAEITKALAKILEEYTIIILSGGVSKGKFDFIPKALSELGVKQLFHKIKQRPGKPFWFGKAPGGAVVFALPGNPVSSFMCTHRYFYPWLQSSLGLKSENLPHAILEKDVTFTPDLTYFVQVKIRFDSEGRILAMPVEGHGSGDLANLVDADAFMELPQGKDIYSKGEVYPLLIYR